MSAAGLPDLPCAAGAWLPAGLVERLLGPMLADRSAHQAARTVLGAPIVAHALARLGRPDEALAAPALAALVMTRATRRAAVRLVGELGAAGIATIALKGLATGALLYPHPALRPLPDIDLLVHDRDVARLARWFAANGWATRPEHLTVRRWGALTDASFAPVAPVEGGLLVDIHRAVDDPPASLGMIAEDVFGAAHVADTEDGAFAAPAPEHLFITLALHAFRDFYEPRGLKGLLDAALLLERHGESLPWDTVERAAERGRFVNRVLLYRELVAAVGGGRATVFVGRDDSALSQWAARIADNMRALGWARMPDRAKVRVEFAALDRRRDVTRLYLRRLAGLARPRSHALPGVPVSPTVSWSAR